MKQAKASMKHAKDIARHLKPEERRPRFLRGLSLLFCLALLAGVLQVGVFADDVRAQITLDGESVRTVTLPEGERLTVRAEHAATLLPVSYQWQILSDTKAGQWVDIYDGTARELTLSYALVQSLLDVSGSAYVRCALSVAGDERFSDPLCVTVAYGAPYAEGRAAVQAAAAVPAADDVPEEKLISVTINYLDAVSGLPIYSPYTGRVDVSVEAYQTTVVSPTYLGYAPYYNSKDPAAAFVAGQEPDTPDAASVIELDIPLGYTGDTVVVNVYYKAIAVPYAVRFFFQNIYDDEYTENAGLYTLKTAKTGTLISNEMLISLVDPEATKGFTKRYHHPEAVAADGSSVFECHYDRNYRILKFDADGGYGAEPIYARYGTPFLVNTPTKHGYVFAGWDLLNENGKGDGIADPLPSTIPDESQSYIALWVSADTTYSIAYWLQNADDDGYSYVGMQKKAAKSGVTVYPQNDLTKTTLICGKEDGENGHHHSELCQPQEFDHVLYDEEKNAQSGALTVKGDGSSVLNVYYTRKYYTLRFIYAKEYDHEQDRDPNYDTNNDLTGDQFSVYGSSSYGFGNKDYLNWFLGKYGSHYSLEDLIAGLREKSRNGDGWGLIDGDAPPTVQDPDVDGAKYVLGVYPKPGEGCTDKNSDGVPASGDFDQFGDRYYYFELTARFGADLTELWPIDPFGPVAVKEPSSHIDNEGYKNLVGENGTKGWGNYAYLAGWNGEYKVKYSLDNSNSTVKGLYQKMDERILLGAGYGYADEGDQIDRQITTKATVGGTQVQSNVCYFVNFFNNGTGIRWNKPRQWVYESYVPVFSHELDADQIALIRAAAENTDESKRTYTDEETGNVYYYHNDTVYRLYGRITTSDDNVIDAANGVCGQTQTGLDGFTRESESRRYELVDNGTLDDLRRSFIARFFYKRNTYTLTRQSYHEVIDHSSRVFDEPLDPVMLDGNGEPVQPTYPSTLEENAYYFDGWYSSPGCFAGSEYVPGSRMPSSNLALYAKWSPQVHTVRFFRSLDDMRRYQETKDEKIPLLTKKVEHGLVLGGSVNDPTDDQGYIFGGWFYERAGKRLAYTPLDQPVLRDMDVFAGWGSLQLQPYRIHYALHEAENDPAWTALLAAAAAEPTDNGAYTVENGTQQRTYIYLAADGGFHRTVADDTDGFAYQGNARTFTPKVGQPYAQLYEEFGNGYYPTLASHSVTMQPENDKEDPRVNVFTFTYVHKEKVAYRVEYRYADTNRLIDTVGDGGIVEKETTDGVVTERFAVVTGYIPDAFFKRLILAVEKNEDGEYVSAASNVIVFYYTKNVTSAYYAVHYMLQNLDAAGDDRTQVDGKFVNYTESSAHTEGIGDVGKTCEIVPQTFSGFTVQDSALVDGTTQTPLMPGEDGRSQFTITVTQNGTELYIFYTRNELAYKVYYLQYGTDISDLSKLTYTDGTSNGVLRPIVSDKARFGATVSASAADVSIGGMTCISALTQSITIGASEAQNYIIFFYTPVQVAIEYKVWHHGGGTLNTTLEVFDAKAGEIKGSTATALEGYTFAGWYIDEDCTVSAEESGKGTVTGTKLLPNANRLDVMPTVNVYYAKFLPLAGSLTIERKNGENDEGNGRQVFVYRIRAVNDPDFSLDVTIIGDGSVTVSDLPCRAYTVEQIGTWSWRYADKAQTVTVTADGTSVTFGGDAAVKTWLNGNSALLRNKKKG